MKLGVYKNNKATHLLLGTGTWLILLKTWSAWKRKTIKISRSVEPCSNTLIQFVKEFQVYFVYSLSGRKNRATSCCFHCDTSLSTFLMMLYGCTSIAIAISTFSVLHFHLTSFESWARHISTLFNHSILWFNYVYPRNGKW